ncbi:MAG: hypothetical protein K9L28_09300 [Synergistales bacterium]|nr:hypothetical protein [Synergistales bacterium]
MIVVLVAVMLIVGTSFYIVTGYFSPSEETVSRLELDNAALSALGEGKNWLYDHCRSGDEPPVWVDNNDNGSLDIGDGAPLYRALVAISSRDHTSRDLYRAYSSYDDQIQAWVSVLDQNYTPAHEEEAYAACVPAQRMAPDGGGDADAGASGTGGTVSPAEPDSGDVGLGPIPEPSGEPLYVGDAWSTVSPDYLTIGEALGDYDFSSGDQIWVAGDAYSDDEAVFTLEGDHDGISIMGGFQGFEGRVDERESGRKTELSLDRSPGNILTVDLGNKDTLRGVRIDGFTFTGVRNGTGSDPGVIFLSKLQNNEVAIDFSDCLFYDNYAEIDANEVGSSVFSCSDKSGRNDIDFAFDGCIFRANESKFAGNSKENKGGCGGGAFFATLGSGNRSLSLNFQSCFFDSNTARITGGVGNNGGGAIYATVGNGTNELALTLEGCSFTNNGVVLADGLDNSGGGALYATVGNGNGDLLLTVDESSFVDNSMDIAGASSNSGGGAIYSSAGQGNATLSFTFGVNSFIGNKVKQTQSGTLQYCGGGAQYFDGSMSGLPRVVEAEMYGNSVDILGDSATSYCGGGAIYTKGTMNGSLFSWASFRNNSFTSKNSVGSYCGGGVIYSYASVKGAEYSQCSFSDNTVDIPGAVHETLIGGSVFFGNGSFENVLIENSTFSKNKLSQSGAGAIFMNGAFKNGEINFCTFCGNTQQATPGAVKGNALHCTTNPANTHANSTIFCDPLEDGDTETYPDTISTDGSYNLKKLYDDSGDILEPLERYLITDNTTTGEISGDIHAITTDSEAYNYIDVDLSISEDQRGKPRPAAGAFDCGAYEYQEAAGWVHSYLVRAIARDSGTGKTYAIEESVTVRVDEDGTSMDVNYWNEVRGACLDQLQEDLGFE